MRIQIVLALGIMAGMLVACSSSSGSGGSDPPPTRVIIMPSGSAICPDGTAPPCH